MERTLNKHARTFHFQLLHIFIVRNVMTFIIESNQVEGYLIRLINVLKSKYETEENCRYSWRHEPLFSSSHVALCIDHTTIGSSELLRLYFLPKVLIISASDLLRVHNSID